ncbi:Mu transposase C-terminal domain-containing protein [Marivita sp. GX14005]|uniref:Mu transposase C-terminal domain-containing protein n=1 Tax=Marivita sp. GX14005 TaxID=2942276 RepID=UPI0020194431|nr:Mu transposase C-terminal domain-containing protein [Marivita sp. GX14005]MCL3883572.1 Mu transposase C-terminal domain-containing protein [Marivita sp. GX14005]
MKLYSDHTSMQLAEGTEILMGHRLGEVYRSSVSVCELIWKESFDPDTGEIIPAISDKLSGQEIIDALTRGSLKIVSLPENLGVKPPEIAAAAGPRPAETLRAQWRSSYISAAQTLIEEQILLPFRADFERKIAEIVRVGLANEMRRKRRSGKPIRAGQPTSFSQPPKSGKTIFLWWKRFKELGAAGAFDRYRDCGNRLSRFSDELLLIMREVVALRLTEERPSIASIVDSVRARVRVENRRLTSCDPHAETLLVPGYQAIWSLIESMAPMDHKVRTRGMEVAYRDLHTLGQGLQISRALQRVELDEYTVDLMVFMRLLDLEKLLTPSEKIALCLTGEPKRLILSAAIDVYSGAIVAMQIAAEGSMNLTVKTIEMIYCDKQRIADAVGAVNPWPMHGHPQTLALDRAVVNMSDEIYTRLAAAGITNFAVPAGKPFLKPWIERFFATLGAMFLQQFTGRTFSDVVSKGENDPAKRATLTLEEFLNWLVRWIVDVHHTRKPETLGRSAPLYEWERAVAEVPPVILNDESRLRRAFGDRLERLVTRKGVEVKGIHYIAPEISEWFLNEAERELEVWWWHQKIGRVEVLLPNGKWVTAHSKDDQWADKSYADLAVLIEQGKAERLQGQEVRDDYRVAADARTAELAGLKGLLPLPLNEKQRAARTDDFMRYTRFRENDLAPAPDLFDGAVTPFDGHAATHESDNTDQDDRSKPSDPGDIME